MAAANPIPASNVGIMMPTSHIVCRLRPAAFGQLPALDAGLRAETPVERRSRRAA
jgi:hypothetical protein